MKSPYTIFMEGSVKDFELVSDDFDAVDFLREPKNFRPFHVGLLELLQKKFPEEKITDAVAASERLSEALRKIDSKLNPKTVRAWFTGEHRPKIEPRSRRSMYEICFALGLTLEEVQWFFHHVYFDRAFNCHSVAEVVFYFSFVHGLSYSEACKIIDEIKAAPEVEDTSAESVGQIYTQLVKNQIAELQTVDELKNFLLQNKNGFRSWNNTALNYVKNFFAEIVGDEEKSRPIVQKIKRLSERRQSGEIELDVEQLNQCGLLMREIFSDARNKKYPRKYDVEKIIDRVSGKNIFSRTFVLDNLLTTFTGIKKDLDVPYVVKNNFPSKKILSDVLDATKASTSEAYDPIRKTLVLFYFYIFRCKVKLGEINSSLAENYLAEIFIDEMNSLLEECGYESLYAGNPYDWLFLCAVNREDPLDFFRLTVSGLLEEDDQ